MKDFKEKTVNNASIKLLFLFIAIIIIFGFCSKVYFSNYKEWINLMMNIIATLIGAWATIYAVIKTIKHESNKKLKEENEEIKLAATILYNELYSYLYKSEEYILKMLYERIKNKFIADSEFESYVRNITYYDNIYFFSNDIRNYMYKILKRINTDKRQNLLIILSNFYTVYLKTIKQYNNNCTKAFMLLTNLSHENMNKEYDKLKIDIMYNCSLCIDDIDNIDNIDKFKEDLDRWNNELNKGMLHCNSNLQKLLKEIKSISEG